MGRRQPVKPGITYCSSSSLFATAGEAISKNDILVASGATNGGKLTVTKADHDTAADLTCPLWIAVHSAASGARIEIHPGPYVATDIDTSAFTGGVKDTVYLSDTAGGIKPSGTRVIGSVTKQSATVGSFVFDGSI